MSDERVDGYAEAMLAVAGAEGDSQAIEDELFQFAQALGSSDELRSTLNDDAVPVERRQQIVEDLVQGQASSATRGLISMVVAAGRAEDLPQIIERVGQLGAEQRNKSVAEVRSAVPLDADQQQRLAAALKSSTGKDVEIRVVIDESVMGGLITQIDDEVIDGSVRSRLGQLREAF